MTAMVAAPTDAPPTITLSPDQECALQQILSRVASGARTSVLTGAAGTGKTTVTKELIRRLVVEGWEVVLLAPTNKARLRLQELTGRPAGTIHGKVYRRVLEGDDGKPLFMEPGEAAAGKTIVIVDEASMVGSRLAADLIGNLDEAVTILAIGDPYQLAPVKDVRGFDLDHPHAQLLKVHRQAAGNPVLAYATAIREGWGPSFLDQWIRGSNGQDPRLFVCQGSHSDAASWVIGDARGTNPVSLDRTVLTYMHTDRIKINQAALGYRAQSNPDQDARRIRAGDRIVIQQNDERDGFVNGDLVTIKQMRIAGNDIDHGPLIRITTTDQRVTIIAPRLFEYEGKWMEVQKDIRKRNRGMAPLKATWGWCLTVHVSQGSQWPEVVVFAPPRMLMDRAEERRLLYTAVTRASDKLIMILPRGDA